MLNGIHTHFMLRILTFDTYKKKSDMQIHQSTKYLVIKRKVMEVEELPFTTLKTNEIMALLILTAQKNYFQIVNIQ